MSVNKTQTQDYTVVKVEDKFEIRHYPAATMAMIHENTKDYKVLGKTGFRKLAGYIFGGNNEKKKMAMTAPVHMNISDTSATMAFVLPNSATETSFPKPNDATIAILTSEPEFVAAIQFGGFASNDNIHKQKLLLEQLLIAKGIKYYGNFRFLGYNPPYQILGRRNEVIVSVKWE